MQFFFFLVWVTAAVAGVLCRVPLHSRATMANEVDAASFNRLINVVAKNGM